MSPDDTIIRRRSEPPKPPTEPDQPVGEQAEESKKKLELSLSQVIGGALAAMTAAALGSTLGVAGTIIGAALASVVAGVAGALYTASLRTGHEKVRTVFRGAPPAGAPADATTVLPAVTGTEAPVWPTAGTEAPVWTAADGPARPRRRSRFSWKYAVGVTASVFVLAVLALTGWELVTGQALSGGQGTTVSQVRPDADPKPSTAPSQADPSAQPSAPASASTEPSPAPNSPAPTGSPTSEPSTVPSTTPSSPTVEPTLTPGASQPVPTG